VREPRRAVQQEEEASRGVAEDVRALCSVTLTTSAKSNRNNKARLEILKTTSESLQGLFDKAQEALATLSKDSDKYKKLLEELLVQGVLQLFEPKVEVITRSGDVQLVQELKSAAEKRYAEETGRKTEITVKEGLSKDRCVVIPLLRVLTQRGWSDRDGTRRPHPPR